MLFFRPLFLLFLPAVAAAFTLTPRPLQRQWHSRMTVYTEDEQEEPQRLVLGGIGEAMNRLKSKFPTSEVDFLAAARKRAQEARESINNSASDQDWLDLDQQNQQDDDDWEASLNEAGNEESQILIPVQESSNDGSDDEEPKLLLF